MKKNKEYEEFLSRFKFQKEMTGFIGIERERFLSTANGTLVPYAEKFLTQLDNPKWTYELSACQVEDRTTPLYNIKEIKGALKENDCDGKTVARQLGLKLLTIEVAPKNMSLAVYPTPRYLRIKSQITQERLRAACRVTGTHLHFGMPDIKTAIQVSNLLRKYLDYFCKLGSHSNSERLQIYKTMAVHWEPPYYQSSQHFFEIARKEGFVKNPRDCWHLIRISIHGTVELRMFGVTENLDEVCKWIKIVRKIIKRKIFTFPV